MFGVLIFTMIISLRPVKTIDSAHNLCVRLVNMIINKQPGQATFTFKREMIGGQNYFIELKLIISTV